MNDDVLRQSLVDLLTKGNAHVSAADALRDVTPALRARRPPAGSHSPWELLEHLRLAQEDILRYTLDPAWVSPPFPQGYWPAPTTDVSDATWEASVRLFLADLQEVVDMATHPRRDLTALIPHGEGRTYLRQVLLVADHNAYHLGQLVEARKMLGDWPSR